MIILIVIVLTAVCLMVLALPFLQKGRERSPSGASARLDRQRLYGDLRLLDEERLLGHISDSDYQRQAEEIRLRAAELVRQEETEARAVEAARAAAKGKGRRGGPSPR